MTDLIISVADGYQEKVIEALLPRVPLASNTRHFTFDIIKNPGHDPGSYNDSHELLRPFINQYHFAIVLFDFEGIGVEHLSPSEIQSDVHNLLNSNGWNERNAVIVICPELETWMWMDNRHVQDAIGWDRNSSLYDWARQNNYLEDGRLKPNRPKETLEEALKLCETSKSASIYKNIAARASYRNCQDPSFRYFIDTLQNWFPITQ